LVAVAVLAAFLVWFGRVGWPRRWSGPAIVAAFVAWQIAIACGVAMIDPPARLPAEPKTAVKRPWQKLWEPYAVHHASDYLGAVPRIETPRRFLHDYVELMPDLPLHCRSHPPGGPLFLWLVEQLFGAGVVPASLATILFGGLAVPAVYLLARDVLDESPARLAVGLYLLAPNVVCYSATCMDAVFNVPMVWSIFCLWKLRGGRPMVYGMAAGAAAALAAFMTFSASFLVLWAVVLAAWTAWADRKRFFNTMLGLGAAALTAAAIYVALHLWSGYDVFATLREAIRGQNAIVEDRGHNSLRQDFHFSIANLAAFFFCAGLPLTALWGKQLWAELHRATASPGRGLALSFAAALAILDIAPLYTLETERIWLFMVSFLAIGAATQLTSGPSAADSNSNRLSPRAWAAMLLLAGQTVVMEVLFDWFW
ncbi:MAG TPA: glycosyltransferase family 39 protein, partial [Pirellulales bacterium]|nr:glycosyltransferase family 39 protein [Pirellulales bacterium]